jgi:hypothetical protein
MRVEWVGLGWDSQAPGVLSRYLYVGMRTLFLLLTSSFPFLAFVSGSIFLSLAA